MDLAYRLTGKSQYAVHSSKSINISNVISTGRPVDKIAVYLYPTIHVYVIYARAKTYPTPRRTDTGAYLGYTLRLHVYKCMLGPLKP
jgi:hypothetical protein